MIVVGLDPGTEESAICGYTSDGLVHNHETLPNEELLRRLTSRTVYGDVLVIERIASYGMAVGEEVFATVFWSGRFAQAWETSLKVTPWDRVYRKDVKQHLCLNNRATDANIRQALYDRFGPSKEKAVGTKKCPGPLYGIRGHEMAALAVAVTWHDTKVSKVSIPTGVGF